LKRLIKGALGVLKSIEIRVLRARAERYGLNLEKTKQIQDNEVFYENYFKTDFNKNALLSYIVYPFKGKIQNNHSNHQECYIIAKILEELEFNVDVINWDNTTFLPCKNYELVIDNHNNLERLFTYFNENTTKIYHATNSFWLYQNSVEYSRYYEFFVKTGIPILPPRLMTPGNSALYADGILMFGNEFTEETYGVYRNKVHHLPMSVTVEAEEMKERDFQTAKRKFIWLNSHGALLKGLDMVIEVFLMMPELELYICGNMDRDTIFLKAIQDQLKSAPNIKIEGWVDVKSEKFKKLAIECAWVISLSFSEGGGGSTLNCMAKGLIPLISKSSSITLPPKTGFYFEYNDVSAVRELLKNVIGLGKEELDERSLNSVNFIESHHTVENFRNKYKEFLIGLLA
jgi:glycosyltransferase involved in cell wall biosynthesis